MPLQTTYSEQMPIGQVGRRANMEEWNTITRSLEGATPLKFGVPVQEGVADHTCVIFSTGDFIGVSEASVTLVHNTVDQFEQYDSVPVCETGVIWVTAGVGGATKRSQAYFIAATGLWTSTAAGAVLVPGAEFDTAGAAGSLVKLRVRRQVPPAA